MSSLFLPERAMGAEGRDGGEVLARAGGVVFSLAERRDEEGIRRLLREQAMAAGGDAGRIRLTMQMEPSFFEAAGLMGRRVQVLVARRDEEIVGVGVRALREVRLGGRRVRMAHLSGLRIAPPFRHQRDLLVAGYGAMGQLQEREPAEVTLTAILGANRGARRLLEAGVRGLPRYEAVAEVETFTIGTRDRRLRLRDREALLGWATPEDREEVLRFLEKELGGTALAPVDEGFAERVGGAGAPAWEDFALVRGTGGRVAGAAAVWDQRSRRQIVITGYDRWLGSARPLWNAVQRMRGRTGLPPPGKVLAMASVSRLAVAGNDAAVFVELLKRLAAKGRSLGAEYLALSLGRAHPLAAVARRFAAHATESILYQVKWGPEHGRGSAIEGIPYVEAALL